MGEYRQGQKRFSPEQLAKLDDIFDKDLTVSVITKIETLGFNAPDPEQKKMVQFINLANILGLSDDIVQQTIDLRKNNKLKTPDAIIAATAIVHNLPLLSRNTKDFKSIPDLTVIDPHTL